MLKISFLILIILIKKLNRLLDLFLYKCYFLIRTQNNKEVEDRKKGTKQTASCTGQIIVKKITQSVPEYNVYISIRMSKKETI
jgi:hypothetical protein